MPIIRDADNRRLMMKRTLRLKIQLGSFVPDVKFIVCGRLGVLVVFGKDFFHSFVEGIYPQKKDMVLDDIATIPITWKASEGAQTD